MDFTPDYELKGTQIKYPIDGQQWNGVTVSLDDYSSFLFEGPNGTFLYRYNTTFNSWTAEANPWDRPKPWEGYDGIWHVKNASETTKLKGGTFSAWDVTFNGSEYSWGNEKKITEFNPGEEIVFVTSDSPDSLFKLNKGTWDFGELTDTSKVKSFRELFYYCESFNSYIGDWDTSNVSDMESVFNVANLFNQDISGWDTSKVVTMNSMFNGGFPSSNGYQKAKHNFNQDISGWDTSNVMSFNGTFGGCLDFNHPIGKWNTDSATDMGAMFFYTNFDQDLSNWNVSNVTKISAMFNESDANPSGIDAWDVSNVQTFLNFAAENKKFNQPIGNWDVSGATDMDRMFYRNKAFNQDLSQWCVRQIPFEPTSFAVSASAYTKPKPVWGTCPRNEDGLGP